MVNTVAVQEFLFSSFKRTLITVGVVLLVMFAVIVTASPVVRTTLLFLIYVAAGIWFGWRAVSAFGRGKTEWGLLLIGCSALSIAIAYNSYDYGVSLHITIRGVLVACYQYTVLGVMSFLRHAFTGQ